MVSQLNISKHLIVLISFSMALLSSPGFGQETSAQDSGSTFGVNLQAVDTLNKIKLLMLDSRTQLGNALSEVVISSAANKKTGLALSRAEAAKAIDSIEKNIDTIHGLWKVYQGSGLSNETKPLADKFAETNTKFMAYGLRSAETALRGNHYSEAKKYVVVSSDLYGAAVNNLDRLIKAQLDTVQVQYQAEIAAAQVSPSVTEDGKAGGNIAKPAPSQVESKHLPAYGIAVLFAGLMLVLAWLISRARLNSLPRATDLVQQIADGKYDNAIEVARSDKLSPLLLALKSLQTRLSSELHNFKQIEHDNLRIKIALDAMSSGIIIVDNDRNIIYANQTVLDILLQMESEIRLKIPQFDVKNLIGMNIDSFHHQPAAQANLIAKLSGSHVGEFELNGKSNRIVATAVVNNKGERLGTVAEWHDRSAAKVAEQEVVDMINAIMAGDFSKRINTADKTGFYKDAGKGINSIVDIFDAWLKEIVRVFSGIESGDLTQKIEDDGREAGVFSELARHSNAAVDNLHALIVQIRLVADAINTAAREMAEGNTDLSQRTEEQASSLEETAASMEELAATVKTNAENAKQANQMALAAASVAAKGGNVVRDVVQTMESINASSSKIVDIISVIDGIAFQTNILALNAAVEAARAGEQGRGFAVVASEVRSLAQKSAAAAKEIKQLISDSVSKVAVGSKQVNEAGGTMDEIVISVKRVTDIMDEISAASVEQSAGIDQVNQAITQMDEVTQQNASLVEESAAAATSLEEQAQALMESVGVFKLSVNTAHTLGFHPHFSATPHAAKAAKPALGKPAIYKSKPVTSYKPDEWEEF